MIDLKEFRKVNNLKQQEIAEIIGCNIAFVSQIERGASPLPREAYDKLISHFGNKLNEYLITRKEANIKQLYSLESAIAKIDNIRGSSNHLSTSIFVAQVISDHFPNGAMDTYIKAKGIDKLADTDLNSLIITIKELSKL